MSDDNCCGSVGARSPTGSISSSGSADYDVALSPTQLLAMAIKKRRHLLEDKQRDYQRELLHSHLIQNLCKFLGEGRARVRRHRRSSSRRKLVRRRRWDDDTSGNGDERGQQVVPDDSRSPSSSPNPSGIVLESTVQSDANFGGDGGSRGPRWLNKRSSHSDDGGPPMKRNRADSSEDGLAFIDLDQPCEVGNFDGAFADGGRKIATLRGVLKMLKHCTQIRSFATHQSTFYDVVIVGGGLVGSAMACSIGTNSALGPSTRVLLLESGRLHSVKQSKEAETKHTYSNRVSAVSPSSVEMFKTFGVWDEICSKRVHPVSALYVEDGCAKSKIHFKQLDKRSPIAHIVENELIVAALQQCIRERCANVEVRHGAVDQNLSVPDNLGQNVTIQFEDGTIETSLLIAADGSKSTARKRAGIDFEETVYEQRAVVGTLALQHNSESDESFAWQRFVPSGPVALLPLGRELCSLVWTVPTADAARLLQLSPEHFVEELNGTLQFDNSSSNSLVNNSLDCLGKALNFLPSKESSAKSTFPRVLSLPYDDRAAFPLSLGYAYDYIRPRVALIGDAAHRVHPLAGQGVNLGWSDVRFLTAALHRAFDEGGDLGSLTYLRDFDSASQRRNGPVIFAIDCLNRLYSTDHPFCTLFRSVGLNILDRVLPAKDLIVHLAS
ncbi:hypothetical protein niasHT_039008 [Heterodera trifolii]|uniref:FAD-binding domain-containing protein n=1 Tax=Heterodera trifolii TaxID=157864 RepID=A0ABD2J191_9BILA